MDRRTNQSKILPWENVVLEIMFAKYDRLKLSYFGNIMQRISFLKNARNINNVNNAMTSRRKKKMISNMVDGPNYNSSMNYNSNMNATLRDIKGQVENRSC